MSQTGCSNPIPLATLLQYWLGELDEARDAQLDEHLLGCGHCSRVLQGVVELGDGMRAALRAGAVHAVLSRDLVQRLAAEGLRLREYRAPHNGSVSCTITPQDDLLITQLDAPLEHVARLDVESVIGEGGVARRLQDVPFDAASGHVVYTSRMDYVRALPATTVRIRLLAVAPEGERLVGEYTFHHTPGRAGEGP